MQKRKEGNSPEIGNWPTSLFSLTRFLWEAEENLWTSSHNVPQWAWTSLQGPNISRTSSMSLFLKKMQKEQSPDFDFKKRSIFFHDRRVVICCLCLLLPGKTSVGKFSVNAACYNFTFLKGISVDLYWGSITVHLDNYHPRTHKRLHLLLMVYMP